MSGVNEALSEYLSVRRALGTQLSWPESSLRDFVGFMAAEGAEFVTTELALRWALRSVGVQQATHSRRLSIVRGFAVWLQATDARTEVPPPRLLPAKHRRPTPHIYTDSQIADLVRATSHLRSRSGVRAATFSVLIRLLAATGMRSGEAFALDIGDVDLVEAVLQIRNSKFGKSRQVPVQLCTCKALAAYSTFRDAAVPGRATSAFLVAASGTRLRPYTARQTFAKLCQAVGLRPSSKNRRSGRGPRLHDLRHTFATRRLVEWYRAGLDVNQLMPRLATYLGHASTVATYWYIQAVPELLRLAADHQEEAPQGHQR